uniref:Uncharacterized protein n=1 Tax=Romanomermis culicivorax TaxID=13658 RepID=A0A915J753_ROMCU
MMSSNLPVFLESMLLGKSQTQAPTDIKLDKETVMAVESLINDIAEESFAIKTEILSETNIIQIKSDDEDVSQTDTTVQTPTAKTISSVTPLSKSLLSSQYHIDWNKGEELRVKAISTKMISMRDLSKIDNDDSKMVPPQIILTRHKLATAQETEIFTPVSTESRTPVLEIKEDRLCDEHSQPIRNI